MAHVRKQIRDQLVSELATPLSATPDKFDIWDREVAPTGSQNHYVVMMTADELVERRTGPRETHRLTFEIISRTVQSGANRAALVADALDSFEVTVIETIEAITTPTFSNARFLGSEMEAAPGGGRAIGKITCTYQVDYEVDPTDMETAL